ncbi:hypothetical protein UFOVP1304_67 [uncultured Caudovirales phage]|uniref:Uncharacterized protein n=1 Tax=uncultured Caudovirales phage TaxID=2100421 RepID=A0A6J5RIJ2_9CAUD|nr:hypothetical protein UFOVP1304_67 [uncultured Caudovirales phage]
MRTLTDEQLIAQVRTVGLIRASQRLRELAQENRELREALSQKSKGLRCEA